MEIKKAGVFILFFLIFGMFLFNVSSQLDDLQDTVDEKTKELEDTKEKFEGVTSGDVDENYLIGEWGKILSSSSSFGPIIQQVGIIFDFLDPVFLFLLGIKSGFNIFFILALILWVSLLWFVYMGFHFFDLFSEGISIISTVIVMAIFSILKIPVRFSEAYINFVVAFFDIPFLEIIFLFLFIVLAVFLIIFSKDLWRFFESWKKNLQKRLDERNRRKLESGAKVAERFSKAMEETDTKFIDYTKV